MMNVISIRTVLPRRMAADMPQRWLPIFSNFVDGLATIGPEPLVASVRQLFGSLRIDAASRSETARNAMWRARIALPRSAISAVRTAHSAGQDLGPPLPAHGGVSDKR